MPDASAAPPFDTRAVAVGLEREFSPGQAGAVTDAIKTAADELATRADVEATVHAAELRLTAELHKAISAQTWKYITFVGVLMAILRYLPVGCAVAS